MNTAHLAIAATAPISIDDHSVGVRLRGLRVHALGAVRVSLGRMPIQSLGGPKAGTHQALGLFGFLFDRAGRGVDKDEATDMIWPDVSIDLADAAFHRTILGLRGTLRQSGFDDAIQLINGRYVLASGVVSWSDTFELERLVDQSVATRDAAQRVELLEACRRMNTADYMDDCPFFGTSSFVEQRRAMFREVRHAVLLELAELYAASGHQALKAIRLAEARGVAGD